MRIWTTALLCLALALLTACEKKDDHNHDHDAPGHKHDDHKHEKEDGDKHHARERKPAPKATGSPVGAAKPGPAHADEVKLTPEAIKYFGISVAPAKQQVLRVTFTAPAMVSYNLERIAHVGTPVSGRVLEMNVRLGDEVKAGDPLAVIASPELGDAQLNLLEKQLRLVTMKPLVDLARSAWERAQALYDQNQGIALAEVEKLKSEYKRTEADAAAVKAESVSAANRLTLLGFEEGAIQAMVRTGQPDPRYTLRAPIRGRIVERQITFGERVKPDQDALFIIADDSTFWVHADVPESRAAAVRIGSPATVRVAALGSAIEGQVSYVAGTVDPATRTISARVELKAIPGLRAGMFAQVDLGADENAKMALAVPEVAVQAVEGVSSVFVPVADEPNTFKAQRVLTGDRVGRMVPVLGGLREGELVVVDGSFVLKAELGKSGASHEH